MVVFDGEDGVVDDVFEVLVVAFGEELHGFGGAVGGVEEAFALGVFANFLDDFVVVLFHELPLVFFIYGGDGGICKAG